MKDDKSIFDTQNVNDLTASVVSQLKSNKRASSLASRILNLFNIKDMLSIDEIIVGLARKFEVDKKRPVIANQLHALVRAGKLMREKGLKGVYKRTDED